MEMIEELAKERAALRNGITVQEAIGHCQAFDVRISILTVDYRLGADGHWIWHVAFSWTHPAAEHRGRAVVALDYDDNADHNPHFVATTSWHHMRECRLNALELGKLTEHEDNRANMPFDQDELPFEDFWGMYARRLEDVLGADNPDLADNHLHQRVAWEHELLDAAADVGDVGDDDVEFEVDDLPFQAVWNGFARRDVFPGPAYHGPPPVVAAPWPPQAEGCKLGPDACALCRRNVDHNRCQRVSHPLDGIPGVCGVFPPPLPPQWNRDLINSVTFYRVEEQGQPLVCPGDMLLYKGHPTAFQRASCRLMGKGGIAWELRPSVIANMHVSTRHLVYVRLGATHVINPALFDNGDYNPEYIDRLHTCTGTYLLSRPWEVRRQAPEGLAERFLFFSLQRRAATYAGAACRAVPFHLEQVTEISLRHHPSLNFDLPLTSFPSEHARLRAQFSLLLQHCPEEMKGVLQDQRNLAMEAFAAGKLSPHFSPITLLRDLHRYGLRVRQAVLLTGAEPVYFCT